MVTVSYDTHDSLDTILDKITTSLDGRKADSIGFASHSLGAGKLHIADQIDMDIDSIAGDSTMIEFWKNIGALTSESGSIDLMGCDIAKGEKGKEFIHKLKEISGRDIAASTDTTGNGDHADWELEEGGVQLVGKYFDGEKIAAYSGEMEGNSITLNGKTLYDTDGDNYFEIDSKEKLIALSQDGSGWDKNYELTADIEFKTSGEDWNGDGYGGDQEGFYSIGDSDNTFSGNFNGNNHTISNLYIHWGGALFGTFAGGSICNLNIFSANIEGGSHCSTLISVLDSDASVTISNCNATGNINSDRLAGGLVGCIYDDGELIITDSSFKGSLSAKYVGGLVGPIWGSGFLTIKTSYTSGNIELIRDASDPSSMGYFAGGLVSDLDRGTIEDSYSTMDIHSDISGNFVAIGGLVGHSQLENNSAVNVKRCYASGNLTAEEGSLGVFFGEANVIDGNCSIVDSYMSVDFSDYTIGLVGTKDDNTVDISGCFFGEQLGGRIYGGYIADGGAFVEPNINITSSTDSKTEVISKWSNSIWDKSTDDPTLKEPSPATNHAPTMNVSTPSWDITSSNAGISVSELLAHFSAFDNDGNALGAAIGMVDNNGMGVFQYSSDNGNNWQTLDAGAASESFLLNGSDKIRFIANSGADKTVGFNLRAWDQTSGVAHTLADTSSANLGGENAFSSELAALIIRTAEINTNEAPTLDITPQLHYANQYMVAKGLSVSVLLGKFSAEDKETGAKISDFSKIGVAIINTSTENLGKWFYSSDDGASWQEMGEYSENSALLLNSTDLVKFERTDGQAETIGLGFRAWDKTSGTAHSTADVSVNGGTTAFSAEAGALGVQLSADQAPTIDNNGLDLTGRVQNPQGILVATILDELHAADADGIPPNMLITELMGKGTWSYSTDNGASWKEITLDKGEVAIDRESHIRFTPEFNQQNAAGFAFYATDGLMKSVNKARVATMPTNEAPVLGKTSLDLSGVMETGITVAALISRFNVSDADDGTDNLKIAISSINTPHGKWQVNENNGAGWKDLTPTVVMDAALEGSDTIRFVPDYGNKDQVNFTFKVWDGKTNNGYSETATVTATPVNQLPILPSNVLDLGDLLKSTTEQFESDQENSLQGRDILTHFNVSDKDNSLDELTINITKVDNAGGGWFYCESGGDWKALGAGVVLTSTSELTYNGTNQGDNQTAKITFKVSDNDGSSQNSAEIQISNTVSSNNGGGGSGSGGSGGESSGNGGNGDNGNSGSDEDNNKIPENGEDNNTDGKLGDNGDKINPSDEINKEDENLNSEESSLNNSDKSNNPKKDIEKELQTKDEQMVLEEVLKNPSGYVFPSNKNFNNLPSINGYHSVYEQKFHDKNSVNVSYEEENIELSGAGNLVHYDEVSGTEFEKDKKTSDVKGLGKDPKYGEKYSLAKEYEEWLDDLKSCKASGGLINESVEIIVDKGAGLTVIKYGTFSIDAVVFLDHMFKGEYKEGVEQIVTMVASKFVPVIREIMGAKDVADWVVRNWKSKLQVETYSALLDTLYYSVVNGIELNDSSVLDVSRQVYENLNSVETAITKLRGDDKISSRGMDDSYIYTKKDSKGNRIHSQGELRDKGMIVDGPNGIYLTPFGVMVLYQKLSKEYRWMEKGSDGKTLLETKINGIVKNQGYVGEIIYPEKTDIWENDSKRYKSAVLRNQ